MRGIASASAPPERSRPRSTWRARWRSAPTGAIQRFYTSRRATLHALAELIAAAGLEHPQQIRTIHFSQRSSTTEVRSFAQLYPSLRPGELIDGTSDPRYRDAWAMARAETFTAAV